MRASRFWIVAAMLGLTACATASLPGARITDIASLAGTYFGSISEISVPDRPVRLVVLPDGSFEITAEGPGGFRFNGHAVAADDGGFVYRYDRGKGRGVVQEGEGRRVLVFTREDDRETISVSKALP